jgi:hypothetical protein
VKAQRRRMMGFLGDKEFTLGVGAYYAVKKCKVAKLLTVGGIYVWWILDIIRILANKLPAANGMQLER